MLRFSGRSNIPERCVPTIKLFCGGTNMWWDFLRIDDRNEQYVYTYGREAIALDGFITYDVKTRKWHVTDPCRGDVGNPGRIAESERKFWQVVKAGFPVRLHVVNR